jgi:hypothetical protein
MKLNNPLPLLLLLLAPIIMLAGSSAPRGIPRVDFGQKDGPDHLGALSVSRENGSIAVFISVAQGRAATPGATNAIAPVDLAALGLQVWLLKTDGSIVQQKTGPGSSASVITMNGFSTSYAVFTFADVPEADIVGIIFRHKGKLFSQPIGPADWKPR